MAWPQHKLLKQFIEYMIGGGVWFWSGYAIFALCYSVIGTNWFIAKLAADIVGFSLNYFLQRYWAFNDNRLNKHEGRVLSRYVTITAINFVIDYLIVGGLKALGVSPYIGLFAAALFFTGWNYAWYRFWVFKPQTSSS